MAILVRQQNRIGSRGMKVFGLLFLLAGLSSFRPVQDRSQFVVTNVHTSNTVAQKLESSAKDISGKNAGQLIKQATALDHGQIE